MNKKLLQASTLLLALASLSTANAVTLENQSSYDTVSITLKASEGNSELRTSTYKVGKKFGKSIPGGIIETAWHNAQAEVPKESVVISAFVTINQVEFSWVKITTLNSLRDVHTFNAANSKLIFTGIGKGRQAQFTYIPQ